MQRHYDNIRLFVDKNIKSERLPNNPDIPIIDMDNAFIYDIIGEDYGKAFKLSEINSGITYYKGQYYFFDHNIIKTPKTYYNEQGYCHSYNIFPITSDIAKKVIEDKSVTFWELYFNCHVNYNHHYVSVRTGGYTYTEMWKSYHSDGNLYVVYNVSPSGLKEGITIGEFFERHYKEYPNSAKGMALNQSTLRNSLLEDVLCI